MFLYFYTGDELKETNRIQKVIFVTGKHYYALDKQRKSTNTKDVAIIRLEGLSPFPTLNIQQEVAKYKNAKCKLMDPLNVKNSYN